MSHRTRCAAIVLAACVSGCLSATHTGPSMMMASGPAALEPISGYVVLANATPLHRAPSPDSTFVKTSESSGLFNDMRIGQGAYKVVSDRGEWIEVEPISLHDGDPRHCESETRGFVDLALTFFVRRANLLPVLQAPAEIAGSDGTSLRFSTGKAMMRDKNDTVRVRAGLYYLQFSEAALHGRIGLSYPSPPQPQLGEAIAELKPEFVNKVSLTDVSISAPGSRHESLPLYSKKTNGAGTLVTLRSMCVEMVARVSSEGVVAPEPHETYTPAPDPWVVEVRGGTKLYARDGGLLGKTLWKTGFHKEVAPVGERRCFIRDLYVVRRTSETSLEVCIEGADIVAR